MKGVGEGGESRRGRTTFTSSVLMQNRRWSRCVERVLVTSQDTLPPRCPYRVVPIVCLLTFAVL